MNHAAVEMKTARPIPREQQGPVEIDPAGAGGDQHGRRDRKRS